VRPREKTIASLPSTARSSFQSVGPKIASLSPKARVRTQQRALKLVAQVRERAASSPIAVHVAAVCSILQLGIAWDGMGLEPTPALLMGSQQAKTKISEEGRIQEARGAQKKAALWCVRFAKVTLKAIVSTLIVCTPSTHLVHHCAWRMFDEQAVPFAGLLLLCG
jgi:hypothetical protein